MHKAYATLSNTSVKCNRQRTNGLSAFSQHEDQYISLKVIIKISNY